MTLKELEVGKSAVIRRVGGEGALRQHFLDMGMIPGAEVTVIKLAPMGDPMEVQVHGYELTLRLAERSKLTFSPLGAAAAVTHSKTAPRTRSTRGWAKTANSTAKRTSTPYRTVPC